MEVCVYNDGFVIMLFVVFVDFCYGNYVWIFSWCIVFFVGIGFILVKNMIYEW